MDYGDFIKTSEFRRLRYQRCLYISSMKPSEKLGVYPKWHKFGIASCDLRNRLRQYKTYWTSDILVWIVASCGQEIDSIESDIRKLEHYIIEKKYIYIRKL